MSTGIKFRFPAAIKMYLVHSKMSLKATLEYKFDRFFIALAVFCREMISVAVMYLILIRFIRIRGWEMNEMLFLYSFLFISYSLFLLFFTGIRDFDEIVYTGELDRYLIRPVGVITQVIGSRADYGAFIGHGTVGVLLLIYTVNSVGIVWNLKNILYYIAAIAGGAFIQASIFMFASCFSFWAIKTENIRNMIFFNCRRFAGYPISFYPGGIRNLLIFLIPFAFVSYFPSLYYLRKPEIAEIFNGYLYMTPFVGILLFVLVYFFWRKGLRKYSSAGNSYF